ncbi:hypothetical protein [Larkinella soli]|uniref:hypothetical protein n=1 Tax=Larkinella soli TaxID=1770527 RepID=UPI000FFC25BC|nr:hypothetical protein [Larkinella soli]
MRNDYGFVILLLSFVVTGCMAPNCPIKSCHVRMEHPHGGKVYRGTVLGTMHGPAWWVSNRKGEGASASMARDKKGSDEGGSDGKKKQKFKKRFRWERM